MIISITTLDNDPVLFSRWVLRSCRHYRNVIAPSCYACEKPLVMLLWNAMTNDEGLDG